MNYTRQIKIYPSSASDTEYPDMIQLLCATISITRTAKACNSTATSYSNSSADLARKIRTCRLSASQLPVNATIYVKIYFLILIALCPRAKSEFLSMTSIITQMCCLKESSYLNIHHCKVFQPVFMFFTPPDHLFMLQHAVYCLKIN